MKLKFFTIAAVFGVLTSLGISYFKIEPPKANAETTQPVTDTVFTNDIVTPDEQNNIRVFRDVSPSVVFVTNTQLRRRLFSANVMEIPRGNGTGFIWDKSGLIVTNYHVVAGASKITITLENGATYEAEPVGVLQRKILRCCELTLQTRT